MSVLLFDFIAVNTKQEAQYRFHFN